MRKYLIAIPVILAIVACARTESVPDTVQVRCRLAYESFLTRASGGAMLSQVFVGVFDEDGTPLEALRQVLEPGTDVLVLPLLRDRFYTIAFWAQSPERYLKSSDWTAAGLRTIPLAGGQAAGTEETDVFIAVETVAVSQSFTRTVTLTRPFARLDFIHTATVPTDVVRTALSVDSVPTVWDLLTGQGSASETVTFAAAGLPDETWDGHPVLAFAYVPVGTTATVSATVRFIHEDDTETSFTVPSVPLRANYRTRVMGELIP